MDVGSNGVLLCYLTLGEHLILYDMLVVVCKALKLDFVCSIPPNVRIQSWETYHMLDEFVDHFCFVLILCATFGIKYCKCSFFCENVNVLLVVYVETE
jgi:hypothetical protein